METIIIVGHGSVEKEAGNVEFIANHLHALVHGECDKNCVRTAYLQFMEPDLKSAIAECIEAGARKIIVHPYFLSSGVHVMKNIPEIIKDAEARYPDVEFVLTKHLGAHPKLVEVVLERIKEVSGRQYE